MSDSRQRLIAALAADLTPVTRAGATDRALLAWLIAAAAWSWLATLWAGPLRPGALANLLDFPLFALESVVAATAIAALAHAALRLAVPGARSALHWPLLLMGAWIGINAAGLAWPAHPASMLGKREHCVWEAVSISLPVLALLLWAVRRQFPVRPSLTASVAGLAAGALPASIMQFACMYSPSHNLLFHIAPIAYTACLGALLGRYVLARGRPGTGRP